MGNIYNRISVLCNEKGVTPSRMCLDIGLSKSLITEIKAGRTKQLSAFTAAKISDYFSIPTDFLLERPPFDCWDLINEDRIGFLRSTGFDSTDLDLTWGIDIDNPDAASTHDFIMFISQTIDFVAATEGGNWVVELKQAFQKKEKAPAPEGERKVSDEDIKFALWGDTSNITDDDLEDVKRYAAFIRERKRKDD